MESKLETFYQAKIIKQLKREGWLVIRLRHVSPAGMPDLLALKDGKAVFVETKKPDGVPRPLQEYMHKKINQAGFKVLVGSKIILE